MTKRFIALSLLLSMLALLSCTGEPSGEVGETTVGSSAETTAAESAAKLELEPRDFEGRTFTFLTTHWGSYSPLDFVDIKVDESNGEVLNDAAYDRNIAMTDKYSCEVDTVVAADAAESLTLVAQAVLAGDATYDAVIMRGTNIATAMTEGYLTDLGKVEHLDFSKPWWDSNFVDTMTFGGKTLGAVGYVSTNHMNSVWTVCFNKQLIEEYKLDDPYKLVTDGKWTFEKAVKMSADTARDLNGDTKMDGNDLWGINHTHDTVIGILNACGVRIAEPSDDGISLVLDSEKSTDRMLDILTKLFNEDYAMDTLTRDIMRSKDSDGDYFAENKVLFLFTATHLVWQLRQMELDFGMIPYPKYSESEDYASSTAGIFLPITAIPKSVEDSEAVGYFLEAYAYEGYEKLKPAFYDNVLHGKLARDEDSRATLDYIYGNIEYDVGNLLNIGDIVTKIASMSTTLDTDVASFLAEKLPAVEAEVEKFNEALK